MGVTFIAPQEVYTSPAKLTTKSITDNGTYSALDDNANGYSSVTVNIPSPTGKITITENGTDINVAQYATADVSVEGGGGSSDFSTAEVTVSGLHNSETLQIYAVYERDGMSVISTISNGTSQVILYKGSQTGFTAYEASAIEITGNASKEDIGEGTLITITGDCTITIS